MCFGVDQQKALEDAIEAAADTALSDAENKFKKNQHSDTSCDGTQIGIFGTAGGEVIQTIFLPIVSKTNVMAAVAGRRSDFGENHEHIVPSGPQPCVKEELKAASNPADYVEPPICVELPVYRSLGGDSSANTATPDPPEFILDKGVCVENSDGSKIITLRTADIAKSDEDLQKDIDSGSSRFPTKVDYLQAAKKAAWKEFKRACDENDVEMSALFECTGEKDDNGRDIIEPSAIIGFLEVFYPCLLPGCDVILLIPPIKDGVATMNTAFSMCLKYPKMPKTLWLPSLHHNDAEVVGDVNKVDEDYLIFSNMDISLTIPDFATGVSTDVRLCESHDFLPDIPSHKRFSTMFSPELANVASHMHNDEEIDYEAWEIACVRFQKQRHAEIKKAFEESGNFGDHVMFNWSNPLCFKMTNLLGMEIPKISLYAKVLDFTRIFGSDHTEDLRGRMSKKRKADKDAQEQPSKRAAPSSATNQPVAAEPPAAAVAQPPTSDLMDVTDVVPAPEDDEFTQMLKLVLACPLSPAASSMAVFIARGMNRMYAPGSGIDKECIKVDLMTKEHKTQLAVMLKTVISAE